MEQTLHIPEIATINIRLAGGPVRGLLRPFHPLKGALLPYKKGIVEGATVEPVDSGDPAGSFLILPKASSAKDLPNRILISPSGPPLSASARRQARWMRPKPGNAMSLSACEEASAAVRVSWAGQFTFKAEVRDGDDVEEQGLRPPQIGALHAILAHWTVTYDAATIVMPTGTGKTETMLALLVVQQLNRVLVIVPTNALREQISEKFCTLGVLQRFGVVGSAAMLPVVGTLLHRPKSPDEAEDFIRRCNVVVTTAAIAGSCSDAVGAKFAELCSHLIVDEAHHVAAPTWAKIRSCFKGKAILQFTATPYRGDGKLVDGKVVYNYPLRKAQIERYFKPINFKAIQEFNAERSDERIATVALQQLAADQAAGYDHLLLARCSSISRAEQLHALYQTLAPEFKPLLAHSQLSSAENRLSVRRLHERDSRIVVCVDMFGEGFDLPELKIAALHDVHKGLAVTLQFTGRFTRTNPNVGDATVVANTADVDVGEALQALYGEDPDWNHLLRELSEQATGTQVTRSEFVRGFSNFPEHIPLQNVFPKMSSVVFQTRCNMWKPEKGKKALRHLYDEPAIHMKERVLVIVTKEFMPVSWGDVRRISDTVYDLYLLHWDEQTKLLYIHSSNNNSLHENLAKAVCGDDVSPIKGEAVFRVLYGINRLILMNLGLGHSLSRAVRFTMHVGADIREGITQAHAQNKFKTNIFGRGYEGGNKASVGCSRKGRIWSFRTAGDISEWSRWCHEIGRKLLNSKIDVSDVLKGAMIPAQVKDRPAKVPLTIEWSEDLLGRNDDAVRVALAGVEVPFHEVGIELVDHVDTGPIRFKVSSELWAAKSVEYEMQFKQDRIDYCPSQGLELTIMIGKRCRPLSEYLQGEPPVIRFHDGSFLIYDNLFTQPGPRPVLFDRARIEGWEWTNIDLRKESQEQSKRADSIQRFVIEKLLEAAGNERFDVVFDDDESGEAADIVAIRVEGVRMLFRLYHCKYSKREDAGARVDDLYAVCGQAQTSVHWRGRPEQLLDHLIHREAKRTSKGGVSRFERGSLKLLTQLKRRLRLLQPEFQIFIVQPGLSAAAAKTDHLELLAVTELHLKETFAVPLVVIASP